MNKKVSMKKKVKDQTGPGLTQVGNHYETGRRQMWRNWVREGMLACEKSERATWG